MIDLRTLIELSRARIGMTQADLCRGIIRPTKYIQWRERRVAKLDTHIVGKLMARVGLVVVRPKGRKISRSITIPPVKTCDKSAHNLLENP